MESTLKIFENFPKIYIDTKNLEILFPINKISSCHGIEDAIIVMYNAWKAIQQYTLNEAEK